MAARGLGATSARNTAVSTPMGTPSKIASVVPTIEVRITHRIPNFGDNLAKLAHKAMESGGTLTIELYLQMQKGQYDNAFGIGCVLIVIVLILNLLTKLAANKLRRE